MRTWSVTVNSSSPEFSLILIHDQDQKITLRAESAIKIVVRLSELPIRTNLSGRATSSFTVNQDRPSIHWCIFGRG